MTNAEIAAQARKPYADAIKKLSDENMQLRDLLKEAMETWIKVGYGASHEDVAQCNDFYARCKDAIQS